MHKLNTTVCLILCALVTSGCASMSTNGEAEDDFSKNQANESSGLYEGEPEVVFATEFPVDSAEEAVGRADHALGQGDMDLALYMYVRAYDMDKENLHALMRIGGIHESRGNNELAKRAFTAVLHVDPTHPKALQSLGLIYLQAKRHDEALALLEQAVAADPALWRAQNGIGVVADIRGDHDKAISAYDAALATNPKASSVLNNRGYSYYLEGQYQQAARDFVAAADMGLERAWLNLGLVQARQKKYSMAVHTMTRLVASEVAYNDVGYIAMRQGDLGVAQRYFRKAIQTSPRYFEAAQRNLTLLGADSVGDKSAELAVANSEGG
jgi:tetratricopeptide (TPR) repeat protein